jgi:N6-L-threonylcarbamoyladenine synthase
MIRKAQPSNGANRTETYDERVAPAVTPRIAQGVCHYYDFSFSGLKTATLRAVQREVGKDFTFPSRDLAALLNDVQRVNFAASFQRTAVETLVDTAERAFMDYSPKSVVIAGGVAANQELRRILSDRLPIPIEYAPMRLCTDNGAMIATLGYYYAQKCQPIDPNDLEVVPSLSMTKTTWS